MVLINGCSFNKNSKFWTTAQNISQEKSTNYKEIFVEEQALSKELNANLSIKLGNIINNNFRNRDHFNNDGRLNFEGVLKRSSRYIHFLLVASLLLSFSLYF